jgi:hypothetical protein
MTSGECASGSYILTNENNVQVAGLTAAQANFGDEDVQIFCVGVAGMDELNGQQQLWSIYPNPADKMLNIDLSAIEGTKTIVVTSPAGQVVYRLETASGQEAVQLNGLAKGVYFVSLTSATATTTKTFVVK